MKKVAKVLLIVFGILIGILLIDTIQAKIFNNKPILKVVEYYNGGNLYQKDKSLLVDTYTCTNGKKETIFKWEKFDCPIDNVDDIYNDKENNNDSQIELFMLGLTLDDGRHVFFTFDVSYMDRDNPSLFDALTNKKITIEDFLNKLDYIDSLKDGGSRIYKYSKNKMKFGKENFYVIACNSLDDIHDIYIAKNMDSLDDKCSIKIDDLSGVSMTIKNGTLTNTSATVVITDTSGRENVYGSQYRIDKNVNGTWESLKTIDGNDWTEVAWTLIGYHVDKNNLLEMDINWENLYGKLENGQYRIVKDTGFAGEGTIHYITTEFSIE